MKASTSLARQRGSGGLLVACLITTGCLGSPDPSTEFLTLPRASGAAPSSDLQGVTVGLGPFTVAPHLQRRSLAYRMDQRRVEFADSAQWAAPLDDMISQYVTSRVGRGIGTERVTPFPWPQSRTPDLQAVLHVEEFAVGPGREVTVAARWTLREPATGRGLAGGDWDRTLPVDGGSASDQVLALSTALDELADFLTGQLREQASR